MKNNILISIIIPVKGRLPFVLDAIRSVYRQTEYRDNTEVIIVEDIGNNEDFKPIIAKMFPQLIITDNLGKEGPGSCRNFGLRIARGKYIIFLDSDDQMKENFIEEILKELEFDDQSNAVVCLSDYMYERNMKLKDKLKIIPLTLIKDFTLYLSYLFNGKYLVETSFYLCQISHMIFKRKSIKNLQFNYDYIHGGEDWDFFIGILKKGRIRILPKRLLNFRYTPTSTSLSLMNRKHKWQSYLLLTKRLPKEYKRGIFYKLFLSYIRIYSSSSV